ncbi:hypothetical protein H7X46_00425 [Pseudonocardia sp. C8]|uniref:hypothetical protein n=1 Tax=Pseudonocardia sp. C8 TaxID=2762759 RepID=UPI001642D52D|nr:hypothetical protein [Pseudonocardia sp. C8]MBC3189532.1 hypothetical protein [Pseudonocardia sp. C8]
MGDLIPRSTRPPASAASPATAPAGQDGIARINWEHDRPVGWNLLSELARRALAGAGWATTPALAAWAHAPTTRRDPAGGYWRDTDAWWVDTTILLTVRAREALDQIGTGRDGRPRLRLARSGGGRVQVAAHALTGPPPTGQRWSRPQRPTGSTADPGPVRMTDAAIEVLPRAVQATIGRPTGQGAVRHYPPHGGYHEQVHAYRRVSPTELVVVSAVREAGAFPDPDTAIDAADWHITTYHADVGRPSHTVLAL